MDAEDIPEKQTQAPGAGASTDAAPVTGDDWVKLDKVPARGFVDPSGESLVLATPAEVRVNQDVSFNHVVTLDMHRLRYSVPNTHFMYKCQFSQ